MIKRIHRKNIILHQDNAGIHAALETRQKIPDLSWKILLCLLYCHVFVVLLKANISKIKKISSNREFNFLLIKMKHFSKIELMSLIIISIIVFYNLLTVRKICFFLKTDENFRYIRRFSLLF